MAKSTSRRSTAASTRNRPIRSFVGAPRLVLGRMGPHIEALKDDYKNRKLALLRIAEEEQDIADAEAALAKLSEGAKTLVFFGTGGSSLGGETLAQLAGWNISGVALPGQRNRPRTRFYANLDGGTLESVLQSLDLATSRFIVTSKSGGTAETLAQAIATLTALKAAGLESKSRKCSSASPSPTSPASRTACARSFPSSQFRCSSITPASAAASRA